MSKESTSIHGVGLCGLMFIVLFVGKVFDIKPVGDWSWWLVTAPLWGGLALVVALVVAVALLCLTFVALTDCIKAIRK